MPKTAKYVTLLFGSAGFLSCVLPIMSIYVEGSVSGSLIVRGYNLMEFSAWGGVPLLAPLLILSILMGSHSKAARETGYMVVLVGSVISYLHCFNAARTWLLSIDGSRIAFHPGALVYPFSPVAVLICAKVCTSFYRVYLDRKQKRRWALCDAGPTKV